MDATLQALLDRKEAGEKLAEEENQLFARLAREFLEPNPALGRVGQRGAWSI